MAINIKNAQVEKSVRKLASHLGVDLTQAIGSAVDHELARISHSSARRLAAMRTAVQRITELPIKDHRSNDEILGYDSQGLPQ